MHLNTFKNEESYEMALIFYTFLLFTEWVVTWSVSVKRTFFYTCARKCTKGMQGNASFLSPLYSILCSVLIFLLHLFNYLEMIRGRNTYKNLKIKIRKYIHFWNIIVYFLTGFLIISKEANRVEHISKLIACYNIL